MYPNKKFSELTEAELDKVSGGINDDLDWAVSQKAEALVYAGVIDGYKWYDIMCKAQSSQTVEEFNNRVSAFAADNNLPPEVFII